MTLRLERFDDVGPFLERVRGFLAEREAEHNLLFGIIDALRIDSSFLTGPAYLAAAVADDRVVAVALRTPPNNVVLSEVDDPAGLALIADDLAAADETIPGAVGPAAVVRDFATAWTERTGRPNRLSRAERVFRLSRVVPPRPTPGAMRLAGPPDAELLVAWLTAFAAEAFPPGSPFGDPRATVERWLRTGGKRNYLWVVDGRPVSWAGVGGRTPNGTRVGPVYTPPDERGHGYASAVVAAASQAQLDEGLAFCFLFTDLANPTANRIYQAIGYEPIGDFDELLFG
jgi:uncharacterized protein